MQGQQGLVHTAFGQKTVHALDVVAGRAGNLTGGRTILPDAAAHVDDGFFPFLAINGRHDFSLLLAVNANPSVACYCSQNTSGPAVPLRTARIFS